MHYSISTYSGENGQLYAKIGYDNASCQNLFINQNQLVRQVNFSLLVRIEMDLLPTINSEISIIQPVINPADMNPATIYLNGLKESGRRGIEQSLNLVAGILSAYKINDCRNFNWGAIRFQHTAVLRNYLAELKDENNNDVYKPATVNHILSALRGVLKVAWQLEYMSAEQYQRAVAVKSVRGSSLPAGRELTYGEINGLMESCENDKKICGIRDAAIIAFMYACGPRRHEVVKARLKDYNSKSGRLVITGKGDKQRTVYLENGAREAMEDWLSIRGLEPGPLFYPINKGGHIVYVSTEMSSQTIYKILRKRGIESGVTSFSPHDLRRTFVSDMLDAGVDIVTVSKLAGHASVTTTGRYDRRGEEVKRKAAGVLHVPYRKHHVN
jgi:site-specific recombinase XerD